MIKSKLNTHDLGNRAILYIYTNKRTLEKQGKENSIKNMKILV